MDWIERYQLFLFDFDGLLVNTEELHYAAYVEMCRRRGFELGWALPQFFEAAHTDATGLKEGIYRQFPALYAEEPRWEVLYAEKKAIYQRLLEAGGVQLMPGVEDLLTRLEKRGIKRCVVTNSTKQQVECVKKGLKALQTIPHWITREDYKEPKPSSECYLKAIATYGAPHDQIIGFEDSLRGFQALKGAGAKPVLIAPSWHPQFKTFSPKGILHCESFLEIASLAI